MGGFVTALVPTPSRSLAEEFNVFRVMHHGAHEKQLSNVFARLLAADATHALGNAFQRIFLERINAELPADEQLPSTGTSPTLLGPGEHPQSFCSATGGRPTASEMDGRRLLSSPAPRLWGIFEHTSIAIRRGAGGILISSSSSSR